MLPASPLLSSPVFHAVPVLETDRVRLRGYRPEDYLQFLAMSQNPDFYRYLGPGPMNAEEAWNKLLRGIGHWTLQGFGFWALEDKATGRYIGSAGFADFKRVLEPPLGSVPEAGWVLDPAVHGRGYASEVLTTALAWADAHFAAPRTVCLIHPENQASLRLAHKFGYREFARSSYQNEPIVQLARERAG